MRTGPAPSSTAAGHVHRQHGTLPPDVVIVSAGPNPTMAGVVTVHMEGPPPLPKTDRLRTELEDRGVDPSEVQVELVPAKLVTFD